MVKRLHFLPPLNVVKAWAVSARLCWQSKAESRGEAERQARAAELRPKERGEVVKLARLAEL